MQDWARRIAAGDVRAMARAASLLENGGPAAAVLRNAVRPLAGKAIVLGITGPPGAGKSTLVDAVARTLRNQGQTVGIIAVDPTSRVSGGAILGDRIRMQEHHSDPGIFIRSMATRGSLGGLARSTSDLVMLLDASGKDIVIIETVGVGQAEVEIAALADVTVVVLVPGMGDDIQTIKAGIMEIADIFVINKSDRPGSDTVAQEIRAMLDLSEVRARPAPAIIRAVATEGQGVDELLAAVRERKRERTVPKLSPRAVEQQIEVDHVAIAVKSIDEGLSFYHTQLGLTMTGETRAAAAHVAMLSGGNVRLDLIESAAPDSDVARIVQEPGPGLQHLGLRVKDLDALVTRLRSGGVHVMEEPRMGTGGRSVFIDPQSTGGVLLELIETEEEH
jgi:LAO/AO transport system kinase